MNETKTLNVDGNKRGLKAQEGEYKSSNPLRGENKRREEEERVMESIELHKALMEHKSAYTKEERIEAAQQWFIQGNLRQVSKKLEIAYETLRDWKDRPWWPLAIKYCAKERDKELDAEMSAAMHDALTEVRDRIQHGDWVHDKSGELVRKPLSGRDLTYMVASMHDKRSAIRGTAAGETTQTSDVQKLKLLENKFQELAAKLQAKDITGEYEVIES